MLLAGDIGGTKTILAVYTVEHGPRTPIVEETFPSDDYHSLEAMVRQFLQQNHLDPDEIRHARFGIAGPVIGGRAKVTNLPWVVDEDEMEASLELQSVRLFNDLEAIAVGVPFLEPEDVLVINEGNAVPHGSMGVIAPGTGLGEAYLTWNGERYEAFASEGGHVDFGPTNDLETELLIFLRKRFGRVSYERVCSGIGVPNIYDFLKESEYAQELAEVREQLKNAEDPTPIIFNVAKTSELNCKLCKKTVEMFVSILGAEAGNLALKIMATGGIYLAGGIPPRIIDLLQQDEFFAAFVNKGRMADMLRNIPVQVILNKKVALLGAACHGLQAF